jgi:putative addiction module component (TIGR02574 family)
MTRRAQDVVEQIKTLPDTEKLAVVGSILYELDKPDPAIDQVWADEARARWRAYRQGRADHVSYDEVMARYRRK